MKINLSVFGKGDASKRYTCIARMKFPVVTNAIVKYRVYPNNYVEEYNINCLASLWGKNFFTYTPQLSDIELKGQSNYDTDGLLRITIIDGAFCILIDTKKAFTENVVNVELEVLDMLSFCFQQIYTEGKGMWYSDIPIAIDVADEDLLKATFGMATITHFNNIDNALVSLKDKQGNPNNVYRLKFGGNRVRVPVVVLNNGYKTESSIAEIVFDAMSGANGTGYFYHCENLTDAKIKVYGEAENLYFEILGYAIIHPLLYNANTERVTAIPQTAVLLTNIKIDEATGIPVAAWAKPQIFPMLSNKGELYVGGKLCNAAKVGTFADKPTAPVDGYSYFNTDTNKPMWRYNSKWWYADGTEAVAIV